ncbi:MAG: dihydrofolate reductase [Schleiferiaceae bacterium]
MILKAIVAYAENRVIGKDNDLIWHLPDDLKHFKRHTAGKTIIMGRKTWDSLGGRPLPNRRHIVITRTKDFQANGAEVVHSLEEAVTLAKTEEEVFIVGGAQIYALSLPMIEVLEITEVHAHFEGDAFFPTFDEADFNLVTEEHHPADEKHKHSFTFKTWKRRQ